MGKQKRGISKMVKQDPTHYNIAKLTEIDAALKESAKSPHQPKREKFMKKMKKVALFEGKTASEA